jgi:L-lactate dehydrogenase complex protein LldF
MSGRVVHAPVRSPDPVVRPVLHTASANWAAGRESAKQQVEWDAWRERAKGIRADAIANLPELLARLEERLVAAGARVHHAATAADARDRVVRICAERGLTRAVKSKSMLTEEIALNPALASAGIEAVETDLGEWIVQLLGDRPSHILAPAVHLSAERVAELFSERSGEHFDAADTSKLVGYARRALRAAFLEGQVGITGANFAVAESGTLILVESEGNIRLCSSLPRVHIAVMGIEKVLRDWTGAAHMVQMLALAAHGKRAPTYTSLITGPAAEGDDGPDELHVVLVDDGRSALRGTELESALHCIRCGACLYACPVYRQVGGHAYGAAYSGPIGAVITPALEDSAPPSNQLPWMSSLCGACTEACPVGIPLDEHLVTLRAQAHRHDAGGAAERAFWEGWARLWSRPASYRATAATAGRALAPLWRAAGGRGGWIHRAPGPFAGWTNERDAPPPAPEPFHVRWRRARGR